MKIPILMYHDLVRGKARDKVKDSYTLAEADFLAHMERLRSSGYRPVLVDELYRSVADRSFELPDKSVAITFDDGHESNLTVAVPILKRFGFVATFFITTDRMGKAGYMNPAQLRELKKAGMSVQSHAKTHLFLSELGDAELAGELAESKQALEGIVGPGVDFISFPGGRYNASVLEQAKQAGYLACFSSVPFYLKRVGGRPLIGRCAVRYTGDSTTFEKLIGQGLIGRSALTAACYSKDILKKVLGNDIYYSLWKRYVSR